MSEESKEEGKFSGRDVSEESEEEETFHGPMCLRRELQGWVQLYQLAGAGVSEEGYRIDKTLSGELKRSGGSAKGAVPANERRRGASTPLSCRILLQKQLAEEKGVVILRF